MNARTSSLRFVAICAALLVTLVAAAMIVGDEAHVLMSSLEIAPLAFGGTFIFNKIASRDVDLDSREKSLSQKLTDSESRAAKLIALLMLGLGALCAAIAAFAPQYLPGIVWVAPAVAGSAGIHLASVI